MVDKPFQFYKKKLYKGWTGLKYIYGYIFQQNFRLKLGILTYEKWVLKLHNKLNKKWCNKLLERKKRTGKTGQLCRLIALCVLPSFLMKCADFRRCLGSNSAHLKIDSYLLLNKSLFFVGANVYRDLRDFHRFFLQYRLG